MNIGTAEAAVAPDREKDEPKDGPLLLLSAKKPESPSTQQPSVAKADAQEADDFFLVDETDHVEANAYFEAAVEEEMWDSMATEYLTRLKTKSLRHEEVKRQLKKRYERMRQQGMENFRNNAPLYREATERISRECAS
ncbi:unnamed protein product [Amoebophrya sp. A25]|nr:unnamed protein product [Amoebophrya sp. A25]|eukprot:GSA25T00018103001.1